MSPRRFPCCIWHQKSILRCLHVPRSGIPVSLSHLFPELQVLPSPLSLLFRAVFPRSVPAQIPRAASTPLPWLPAFSSGVPDLRSIREQIPAILQDFLPLLRAGSS